MFLFHDIFKRQLQNDEYYNVTIKIFILELYTLTYEKTAPYSDKIF